MKNSKFRSGLMATTTFFGAVLSVAFVPALVATVATTLAPTAAHAQSAVGSVTGKASPSATVTITDTDTGVIHSTKASSKGEFSFGQLPPGNYVVAAGGKTSNVTVSAGVGTAVEFEDSTVVTVSRSRAINPIDVKSVESTSIFTATQIENLPVGREISSVALLAPGTVKNGSPADFGNTVSIGGSSVAENGYYINGFDVTNLRNMLSYADLPFDAIGQQQIKTGGYGAEYGRSLGGVLSLVTKRGTNTWKFGGSVSVKARELTGHGKDAPSIDPNDIASGDLYLGYRSKNESDDASWTNYVSGPIIKDKLFVFAMVEMNRSTSDVYGSQSSYHRENTSPLGLLKLDYYLTPNHHFEYTGILN